MILVLEVDLSWNLYDIKHLPLYNHFFSYKDLSWYLDYLYLFKILLNRWLIYSQVIDDVIDISHQFIVYLL